MLSDSVIYSNYKITCSRSFIYFSVWISFIIRLLRVLYSVLHFFFPFSSVFMCWSVTLSPSFSFPDSFRFLTTPLSWDKEKKSSSFWFSSSSDSHRRLIIFRKTPSSDPVLVFFRILRCWLNLSNETRAHRQCRKDYSSRNTSTLFHRRSFEFIVIHFDIRGSLVSCTYYSVHVHPSCKYILHVSDYDNSRISENTSWSLYWLT